MSYINLHSHTDYSNIRLLDCTNKVEDLIKHAHDIGLKGVAITDHETVAGHVKALQYFQKQKDKEDWKDFKLILGNEIYLVRDGLNKDNYDKETERYFHFILLAKDEVGHRQLRELSSRAWMRSYYQFLERVPTYYSDLEEIIGARPGHVVAATACLGGWLGFHLIKYALLPKTLEGERAKIWQSCLEWIGMMKKIFGADFYLEVQPSVAPEQVAVNKLIYILAKETKTRAIVSTDAHYLNEKERSVHKAFLNAKDGEREVDDFYATTYLMTDKEVKNFLTFSGYDDDMCQWLFDGTIEVGEKCKTYSLESAPDIPLQDPNYYNYQLSLTQYIVYAKKITAEYGLEYFKTFVEAEDEQDRHLVFRILDGIISKYGLHYLETKSTKTIELFTRLNTELEALWKISESLGKRLSAYLITVSKIIEIIWSDGDSLVGPSRGSALGFEIDYLLDITQVSPLGKDMELPHWRFINPFRVTLPDVDIDTQGNRRNRIIEALKKHWGKMRVINVATFGTEKSKSAIQTACRGLGIDVDVAQYLSSMVPSERGQLWPLQDCFYGNEEEGRKPVSAFVKEMTGDYANVWEVAQKIEGLISRRGIHAGGVIIANGDFTEHNAIMKSPKGQLTSQYELHDSEYMGGLKFDLLSVEGLDKIRACIDLLVEYGYIQRKATLKETYMSILNPEDDKILDYVSPDMWDMAAEGRVLSLFQFETQVGGDAIRRTRPRTLVELAIINSLMRLMAAGGEMPMDIYIKHKNNMQTWYREMDEYGLTQEEQAIMRRHLEKRYGVAESQESMMLLAMDEKIANFSVAEADKLRKAVAKKSMKDFDAIEKVFYQKAEEIGTSKAMANYVWQVQIKRQKGYSFSQLHTYGYSIVALQQLNLAYKYPVLFWNTANLIVDSAGEEEEDDETEVLPLDEDGLIKFSEIETDDDDEDDEEATEEEKKEKKASKPINYGKISSAIGKLQSRGIDISPPDINKSKFTFTPDVQRNTIVFGIKGIARINDSLAKEIIQNRPYLSMKSFVDKVKVNKPQMVNLIKCGAFDVIEGKDRETIMKGYISSISDTKQKLTLQNMAMLLKQELIPDSHVFYGKLFNFNKYVKKFKEGVYYLLDDVAFRFYELNFDIDLVYEVNGKRAIQQKDWDKIYKKAMEPMREYLKDPNNNVLEALNSRLTREMWDKYASGSVSKWEMDSISFYYHDHELSGIQEEEYDIRNFFEQPEEATVLKVTKWRGKPYPIYDIYRIAGTVIHKDKTKHLVVVSTPYGVVNVKVWQAQFTKYDRQISAKGADGKKKVLEKSWFSRGNKVMITGFRRGDNFVPKVYSKHKFSFPIELITEITSNGRIRTKAMRVEV